MEYNGEERRKGCPVGFCAEHTDLIVKLASIEQKMDDLINTIKESGTFRTAVVCSLIGVACSIVLVWGDYKLAQGKTENQITVNTHRLDIIESKIFIALDNLK